MQFRSTNSSEPLVSFRDAVLGCLPPDGGLYVPDQAMDIRQLFLYMDGKTSFPELVAAVTPSLLEGNLNPISASRIAESAYNFEPELIRLDDDYSLLNLYNGPTGLFKDFGIAFFAAVLEELQKDAAHSLVIAATHGDTGASMAHAFRGRKGMSVVLAYPSGPIHGLDPATFVHNGGNIIPIQVQGTLDDCQRLVEGAIKDHAFAERYNITSANSINPARLLPQTFYYLYAFTQIKTRLSGALAFSIPCGNFGNLIAGLYAWKFGMPVNGFIAAMNANNALGNFIRGEKFTKGKPFTFGKPFIPRPLIKTKSPVLDVAIPSNLSRLVSFYQEAPAVMRNMVYPAAIDDELTLRTVEQVREKYRVQIDSHTAIAFAAAEQTAAKENWKGYFHTVVLATRHYGREAEPIPEKFTFLKKQVKPVAVIPPNLDAFEGIIAHCF